MLQHTAASRRTSWRAFSSAFSRATSRTLSRAAVFWNSIILTATSKLHHRPVGWSVRAGQGMAGHKFLIHPATTWYCTSSQLQLQPGNAPVANASTSPWCRYGGSDTLCPTCGTCGACPGMGLQTATTTPLTTSTKTCCVRSTHHADAAN